MRILKVLVIGVILILAGAVITIFINGSQAIKSDEEVIIRFAHGQPETNDRHKAVVRLKELIEEKSDMKVYIYPNEQLGSEAEMIESVSLDDLQMVAASAFSQYDSTISMFHLPYLFETYEEAWSVLDGPIGEEAAEPLLEDNLRVISYFENGFRHVSANRPIETPEDFEGLKIRTPEFPISLSTFNSLGANPTPMAFGELYMALQQGTVDAQENPVANLNSSKFYEVQKYLSLTRHQYMPLPVAISDEFWKGLTSEQQKIVQGSADEAAQYHRNLIVNNEEEIMNDIQKEGLEIIHPHTEAFKEMTKGPHDSCRKRYGGELLDKTLKDLDRE